MMFCDHREIIMFIVLGYFIYTNIIKSIFIGDIFLLQYKLSKNNKSFKEQSLMVCLGCRYWRF